MSLQRFLLSLGALAFTVAALAFLFVSTPTLAANGWGETNVRTIENAPPAQNPTLIPQTPDMGDLPPIDLGALGSLNTPTPTPSAVGEGETNVVVENSFDECNTIEDDYILVECKNGQMNFTRKDTRGTRWIYYRPVLTDAMIEVTARLPNSVKNARYGVLFRLDEEGNNFYVFGVTNEGKYGLFRFAEDHYETIIPYTESFYVGNAGFATKIQIINQGDIISINLGGSTIDTIRDPNLKSGRVALFIEPDEPNQTVLFDDLRISEILSPLPVPEPRTVQPAATPTSAGSDIPIFNFDVTPTSAAPQATATPRVIVVTATPGATQTPLVIVVTATPQPATRVPTRAPTRAPTQAANQCPAGPNEAILYISNNYQGKLMRFTIGGGEWGTHDYDVPGDGKYYAIRMPPGRYTYTAHIAGVGKANGERTDYRGGQCYSLRFSP